MKHLVFAALVVLLPQVALSTDAFMIVRGLNYEGAIVPASSPWHPMLWRDPGIRHEYTVRGAWTPTEQQVAAAEAALRTFIERALRDGETGKAPSRDVDVMERGDIRALAANLPELKRQYVGLITDADRMILVHGFKGDQTHRWRTDAILISGAWCGQFWMDFSVTHERMTRLRCGSLD